MTSTDKDEIRRAAEQELDESLRRCVLGTVLAFRLPQDLHAPEEIRAALLDAEDARGEPLTQRTWWARSVAEVSDDELLSRYRRPQDGWRENRAPGASSASYFPGTWVNRRRV